ncbi:MAG: DUF5915 domain-containing protein, partial [Methanoregulaceae archaeon]|nr:DUF5915 domain-containing protein [Methanoregulaceae archaeon]
EIAINPVPKKIGPVFKGEAQKVIEVLKEADSAMVRAGISAGDCVVGGYAISPDMVEFLEKIPENLVAAEFPSGWVYVDVTLTEELKAEGYAREIIRRVQDMRKELDLRVEEKIEASIRVEDEKVLKLVATMKEHIASEVRAKHLDMGPTLDIISWLENLEGSLVKDWSVEDVSMTIGISRGQ